jgi:hypothetical protein
MKGYIEIKEDSYEDTIEHLYRIKKLACKLIDKLAENSEIYEDDETEVSKTRRGRYVY